MLKTLVAVAALALAPPAAAEIVSRSDNAFTLRYATEAQVDPAAIPTSLREVSRWWDGDHTYSGDSGNLSLDLSPGGCWCEALADGTDFDHGRTVSVAADRIVFDAPFGPLRGRATTAELTVTWPGVDKGLEATWTFTVEGPGVGALAEGVDAVMAAGHRRWTQHLQDGAAPSV